MKNNKTKIWLITSTSVALIASVGGVSTVLLKNEVSEEIEEGTAREKGISKESRVEAKAHAGRASSKEVEQDTEENVGLFKDNSIPMEKPVRAETSLLKENTVAENTPRHEPKVDRSAVSKTPVKVVSTPLRPGKENSKNTSSTPKHSTIPNVPAPKASPEAQNLKEKSYWTTAKLNLRSTSSIDGNLLISIPKGTQVKSSQKQNNWFKVTYGNKTGWVSGSYLQEEKPPSSPLSSSKPMPSTPVEKPIEKPIPVPVPTPIIQNLMNRDEAKGHISPYVNENFALMSETGRYSIIIEFVTGNSGKAQMSVDGVNYISGVEIKPEDFGQKGYEDAKAHLALMDGAIRAYAESQFGVNSSESSTLSAEIKKMTLQGKNGDVKEITLQGKVVRIAKEGVRTRIRY